MSTTTYIPRPSAKDEIPIPSGWVVLLLLVPNCVGLCSSLASYQVRSRFEQWGFDGAAKIMVLLNTLDSYVMLFLFRPHTSITISPGVSCSGGGDWTNFRGHVLNKSEINHLPGEVVINPRTISVHDKLGPFPFHILSQPGTDTERKRRKAEEEEESRIEFPGILHRRLRLNECPPMILDILHTTLIHIGPTRSRRTSTNIPLTIREAFVPLPPTQETINYYFFCVPVTDPHDTVLVPFNSPRCLYTL